MTLSGHRGMISIEFSEELMSRRPRSSKGLQANLDSANPVLFGFCFTLGNKARGIKSSMIDLIDHYTHTHANAAREHEKCFLGSPSNQKMDDESVNCHLSRYL